MKAITLHQPWASAIALGLKHYETRSWPTSYRGPIAIHAAKMMPAYARDFADERHHEHPKDLPLRLPLGAFVAVCELTDCQPAEEVALNISADRDLIEAAYGDYTPGRYAWTLERIRPLEHPLPYAGHQRIWNVEGITAAALFEAFRQDLHDVGPLLPEAVRARR